MNSRAVATPMLERWFALQGAPARIDMARSGAPGLDVGELLTTVGLSPASLLDISLDYGAGDGEARLRQAVAAACGIPRAESVVVTHGAIEAMLLLCLARPPSARSRVVVACPAYSGLLSVPATAGHRVERVEIWTPQDGLRIDRFIAAIDGDTTLAIINSPHNPSGADISPTEIERIAAHCAARDVLLVVDEVSRGTLNPAAQSAAQCVAFAEGRIAVIGDISKSMGLGGLRIGWLASADRSLLQAAACAKDHTTVSCSALTQYLAAVALENAPALLRGVQHAAAINRDQLDQLLSRVGGRWQIPVDGLVGFPALPVRPAADELCRELLDHDVSVLPGSLFGWPCHVRIGLGVAPALFAVGLERLEHCLSVDH